MQTRSRPSPLNHDGEKDGKLWHWEAAPLMHSLPAASRGRRNDASVDGRRFLGCGRDTLRSARMSSRRRVELVAASGKITHCVTDEHIRAATQLTNLLTKDRAAAVSAAYTKSSGPKMARAQVPSDPRAGRLSEGLTATPRRTAPRCAPSHQPQPGGPIRLLRRSTGHARDCQGARTK